MLLMFSVLDFNAAWMFPCYSVRIWLGLFFYLSWDHPFKFLFVVERGILLFIEIFVKVQKNVIWQTF
jgi:hypothetical protein